MLGLDGCEIRKGGLPQKSTVCLITKWMLLQAVHLLFLILPESQ
jgi:hypothetical protein